MKKTLRLVGVAAMVLLLAASCKKEEKNNGEKQMMTFSAGIEQTGAKTGLQPGAEQHSFKQVWKKGDAIRVNDNKTVITLDEGCDDKETGTFTGEVTATGKYYAVYPTSATLSGSTATFTLPASQDYVADSYQSNLAPMADYTENNELNFKNLCGLMELSLVGDGITVTGLELSCDKPICGQTAEYTIGGDAALAMPAEAGKTITMNCVTTAYPNGVALNGTTPTSFIFVLPPVTEGDFTLTVTYSGGTQTKTLPENISIGAGKVAYNNTPYKIEAGSSAPDGFVDFGTHVGGIGGTEPLYWAKCNVGASSETQRGSLFMWGGVDDCAVPGHFLTTGNWKFCPYTAGTDACDADNFTKYCNWNVKGYKGYTDSYTSLLAADDAATCSNSLNRTPSKAEWEELISVAYRKNVIDGNGKVTGFYFYIPKDDSHKGKMNTYNSSYSDSDPHIFLPAGWKKYDLVSTGVNYWSNTLCTKIAGDEYCAQAYYFTGSSGTVTFGGRFWGFCVRPVREQNP